MDRYEGGERAEETPREGEERQAFLLALGDAMRAQSGANAMIEVAARLLGERLNASRILFAEFDEARGIAYIFHGWFADGAEPFPAVMRLEDYDGPILEDLRAGRTVRIHDVGDPPFEQPDLAAVTELGVKALLSAPLIVGGRLVVNLSVHQHAARHWTDDEAVLVREVAERLSADLVRARAEAALRESEERYRTLVENVGDHAIFMLDAEGLVTEWTRGAERVKGYSAEEAIGRHLSFFCTPEQVEAGEPGRELAEAAETGRAEREGWRVKKGGGRIWVNEIATAVRDAGGALVGFAKIARDLTERMRAEEALKESEERYRLGADAARLGRWEFTIRGEELKGDAAFNEHHRAAPDADLGMEDHLEAMHPEDREAVRERVARAIEEGGEYEVEYRVPRPDGTARWVLSRGRFVGSEDPASDRLMGVTMDVTERRELEEERERARARELTALAEAAERERISRELHDRVAHGLGVAHQSLELFSALRETDPERAQERLDLAREATKSALDQTRNLSAELKRLQDEELAEGLQGAFEKLADTFAPDGTAMEVSFSGEESAVAAPVGMQAYLTMREAVRNAVKHSGCSRIAVRLVVEDGELRARVEDDGAGFDPNAADATPHDGVGLRSMRERAESLGGTLRVDSEPGSGTRVEMRVPLDGLRP